MSKKIEMNSVQMKIRQGVQPNSKLDKVSIQMKAKQGVQPNLS
jgi:hypothetical protein